MKFEMPGMRTSIRNVPQALRFFVAGGLATLVSWVVRFPLSLVAPFPVAVALAQMIGMVFGFITYRKFVFPNSDRLLAHQVRDFVCVNMLSSVLITVVAVVLATSVLPLLGVTWQTEAIAHALGIATGAFSNYYGHKLFSFRERRPERN